jgi:hypothetical protein
VRSARPGDLELGDPPFGHTKKDRSVADLQLPGELPGEFASLAGDLRGVALHFLALGPQFARPGVKTGITGAVLDAKIKASFSAARETFDQTNHFADIAGQDPVTLPTSWVEMQSIAGQHGNLVATAT